MFQLVSHGSHVLLGIISGKRFVIIACFISEILIRYSLFDIILLVALSSCETPHVRTMSLQTIKELKSDPLILVTCRYVYWIVYPNLGLSTSKKFTLTSAKLAELFRLDIKAALLKYRKVHDVLCMTVMICRFLSIANDILTVVLHQEYLEQEWGSEAIDQEYIEKATTANVEVQEYLQLRVSKRYVEFFQLCTCLFSVEFTCILCFSAFLYSTLLDHPTLAPCRWALLPLKCPLKHRCSDIRL
jgi:hypothetical protein